MSAIFSALSQQLLGLKELLGHLSNTSYAYHSQWLNGGSIGQHTRHVLELLQCLISGYEEGSVNYDDRKRDHMIESNRLVAIQLIDDLAGKIDQEDRVIMLVTNVGPAGSQPAIIASTYHREIVYNLEHAVHHMALIKVSLNEQRIDVVDETFGVAKATIEYRKACAQ